MEIKDQLLEKLAKLSALPLKGDEKQEIKQYLKETLSHFEAIKKIDTTDVEPLISPLKPSLLLREDEVLEFNDKKQILEQAPDKQADLIKVPPTV